MIREGPLVLEGRGGLEIGLTAEVLLLLAELLEGGTTAGVLIRALGPRGGLNFPGANGTAG